MSPLRRTLIALATGVLAVGAVATRVTAQDASPSPADETVTFTVGVTDDLNSANPFRQLDTIEGFVGGLMYDGLLRRAQVDYQPEAELAESWETSDDGLTWTFRLREGLTWSDGEPITAHDFVWTANFIVDNDISSWSDGYTYTDSVVATDDRTIVWTTTKPTLVPGLPGYNLMLPEHVWGDLTVKELKSFKNFPGPVASGSFNLVEWVQGEYWRMEANQDYWDGAPNIDEIVFRVYNSPESVVQALLKGEIDFTTVPTAALFERIRDEEGIGTAIDSAMAFYQMSFNVVDDPASTAHPAIDDPDVRRAVAFAIDRETLVDRIALGYGTPGTTPVVPLLDFWHWEPAGEDAIPYDPAEANRILDDAGYADSDGDGVREMPGGGDPLEWRFFAPSTDPDGIKATSFIRSWLADIGIDATVRTMDDSKLYDLWYAFDWDLILYSWAVGADPDFILSSFTSRQCGFWSDTCYSNPEYDALYRQQQTTLDPDERQAIVQEMQRMIWRDTPEIVLWYPNSFEAWRADRWTGFVRWPEPDGEAFWNNFYSARLVHPVSAEAVEPPSADSGLPGWVWLVGLGAVVAVALLVAAGRRRRADHYA
jgi:peptide/nickel transport system substrate-binding protein